MNSLSDLRRTILWMVFLMSLVLLWDNWNRHNGRPSMFHPAPPAATAPSRATAPLSTSALPTPSGAAATAALPNTGGAAVAQAGTEPASAPPVQQVTVTTDIAKITLDSRGGDVVRLELLKHTDPASASRHVVLFDQSPERLYKAQSGLVSAAGGPALPNHMTPMTVLPGERTLQDGQNEVRVVFQSPEIGGVTLTKTYVFARSNPVIQVRDEVRNVSGAPVDPQLYLQLLRDGNPAPGGSGFYSTYTGPALYTDASKFKKIDFKSIEKRGVGERPDHDTSADNGWVAMVQHYFASAWLLGATSDDRTPREFYTKKVATNEYAIGMLVPMGTLAPGQSKTIDTRLFAGPQEENNLAAIAPGLDRVKDYGLFTIVARPLFWLLTHLHDLLGNWGWSIVALVVLLKIAFYWLNANAYRSMAKMKAVNPKIMELRERLKDQPQQLQSEMMRIYREEKVNPLGGCLPIFAQMPVFIALYWVLLSSVEMRNAPWIGWVHDLSTPDPYFILPLMMTATSFLQARLQPAPPDPVQAKMMMVMPLVFSVMFFFFPAGLVLYYVVNNILSMAQQYVINKRLGVLGK